MQVKMDIAHCEVKFQCPLIWDNLAQTNDDKVRFCDTCQENVYMVEDIENFPKDKKCVMIRFQKLGGERVEIMGDIAPPPPNYQNSNNGNDGQKNCNLN
jgi:hypothetical protein